MFTEKDIWSILSEVEDPEIPIINVVEMGIVRKVNVLPECTEVTITPTYSGCPAMKTIEEDIAEILVEKNIGPFKILTVLSPAWTTDWMTDVAKDKLKKYGIAPPLHSSCELDVFGHNIIQCPQCHSGDTVLLSRFGSTACKALYQCNSCREPFEYFKCH